MKIKKISLLYIVIFILELLLIKEYNFKKHEQNRVIIEKNSISYMLDNTNKYNYKDDVIEYEMILEIPIINLKKGILKKTDQDNNIGKNVTILNESEYPNKEGNVFLAAHSGNGNKSYFNDISKLKLKDEASLYYREIKYTYSVVEIKEINKESNILLSLNTKNNLVLITCSQKDKSKYLIVILNKIKETDY